MELKFDSDAADAKLASVREREEEDVAQILSEKYGLEYADLSIKDIDSESLRAVPKEKAEEAEAVPFGRNAKHLSLAIHNPNNPVLPSVIKDLEAKGFLVKQFLVSKKSLDRVLGRYADLSSATESRAGVFAVTPGSEQAEGASAASLSTLKEELTKAAGGKSFDRISRILEILFTGSLALRASDIHLEAEEYATRLRLRLDGLLTDVFSFDAATYHLLNSRLKILAGMKLNVHDRAQDGRFSITQAGKQVEIRASFIPGNYGESVVLRILNPEATKVSLHDLGMHPKLLARLETEIRRSNGMLLTTGPTGSGKTTTLYSFLREVHTPEIKIITIEDPVEYHLEGIVQTQVTGDKYTFAEGLRSIVRQDPDIIMVGEIRDAETADIAIQAALTGHFVFSTIHTNDAAGTFPRLADLGADPKSFGSAITVAMAQRLVRRLDPEKKKERPVTEKEKAMIATVLDSVVDKSLIPEKIDTVWDPAPANEDETGYHGRVGLYEAIFMDDELANFLRDNPPSHEIAKHAAGQGYLTMAQDGIIKALEGVTSLAEVGETVDLPYA